MSEFDVDAAELWDEVESIFGDPAVWRSSVHDEKNLTVVVDSDYRQIEFRGGETIVTMTIDLKALPARPVPGDQIEVLEGRHKGEYEYYQPVSDDGFTMEIEARRI